MQKCYLHINPIISLAWHHRALFIDYTHSSRIGVNELKCPNCQAENPDDSSFCLRCGTKLVKDALLICPDCGAELPADASFCNKCGHSLIESTKTTASESVRTASEEPTSFLNDRYQVKRKLGEGGKKKVYLVHDKKLDRDVAFALIKIENLDEDGKNESPVKPRLWVNWAITPTSCRSMKLVK